MSTADTPLDLSGDAHVRIAIQLTQARRRVFGELIAIRIRRGITPEQVAEAIGVRTRRVRRFETSGGHEAAFDFVLRYAHAVGATIDMHVEMETLT